jgi:hypothetical protein
LYFSNLVHRFLAKYSLLSLVDSGVIGI